MFKAGDKVLCVEGCMGYLVEGQVYTVARPEGRTGVYLDEGGTHVGWWYNERFVLADDTASGTPVRPHDVVNSPSHYVRGGIELIDVIDAFGLNYGRASLVAYVVRAQRKGAELEDLKKARWYLEREIRKLEEGSK